MAASTPNAAHTTASATPGDPATTHHSDVTTGQDVTALLQVSKGSRFVPVILLLIAGIALALYWLPSGRTMLGDEFERLCKAVAAQDLVKPDPMPQTYGPENYRSWCINADDQTIRLLRFHVEGDQNVWDAPHLETFAGKDVELSGEQAVRMVFAYGKIFVEDLGAALGDYWTTLLAVIASSALFALIPGIAGLIYRRSFWTWFGIAFVLFILGRSALNGISQMVSEEPDTAAQFAAGLSLFVLWQMTAILLASRLRRHSSGAPWLTSLIPPRAYNTVLFLGLVGLGVAVVVYGIAGPAWSALGLSQTWASWNAALLGVPFLYFLLRASPTWTGTVPKTIVVCLDGTSNTPDQLDMGLAAQTNVFKLFKMLKSDPGVLLAAKGRFDATLCKTYKDRQIALYYAGIGNKYDSDPLVGTLSQATGLGAAGIIERAYLDVMRLWRPGDRIAIVGFSRGAASARILSRMIDQRGAPRALWTLRLFGRHWTVWSSGKKDKVPVDILGCWDTVGSFGVAKTIAGINFQQINLLHDLSVPENVRQAYHMVALDEDRQEFEPTLMDPDPIRPERIVEVWFAGGHAGVGGGWATDRLSDVAFDFLLRRISSGYCTDGTTMPGDESWGIYLTGVNGLDSEAMAQVQNGHVEGGSRSAADIEVVLPDPLGQLRTYVSNMYTYRPRQLPLHAVISETVFERMTRSLPVYAPQSLFNLNDALDAKRDLIAQKVARLKETNSLSDPERESVLAFANKLRLTRFPSYWEHVINTRAPQPRAVALANAKASDTPAI